MWKMNCGCNTPDYSYKEYELSDIKNYNIIFPIYEYSEDYCKLKEKFNCDFLKILDKLECGIQPNLEFFLQELSIIQNINSIL